MYYTIAYSMQVCNDNAPASYTTSFKHRQCISWDGMRPTCNSLCIQMFCATQKKRMNSSDLKKKENVVYAKFLQLSICNAFVMQYTSWRLFQENTSLAPTCNAIGQAVATKTVKKSYGLGIHNTWQHVVCLADFRKKLFHMRIIYLRVAALRGIMDNFC